MQLAGGEAVHRVVEGLRLRGREAVRQRVARQMRLDAKADREVGGLDARAQGAVVNLASQVVREHESEHDNGYRAGNGELSQEADPGAKVGERKGQNAKRDGVTESIGANAFIR